MGVSESWTGADLKPMIKLYKSCLKSVLGVKTFLCNGVCYTESVYPCMHRLRSQSDTDNINEFTVFGRRGHNMMMTRYHS